MPEGIGEQGQRPLHERYGFDSEDAMAAAWEAKTKDLGEFKNKARTASDLEKRLADYETAEAKRKESEMSEVDKLKQQIVARDKELADRDGALATARMEVLREKVLASKLGGRPAEEADIYRDLCMLAVAGKQYADEAELIELLKPAEQKFAAFRATLGTGASAGPGLSQSGGPFSGPATGAVVKGLQGRSFADMVEAARNGFRKG